MGRKAGPTKWTKVFRITPDDDRKLEEILQFWQRSKRLLQHEDLYSVRRCRTGAKTILVTTKSKGRNGWQTLWYMWQSNK